jgi:CheY-like chemotaxis protein
MAVRPRQPLVLVIDADREILALMRELLEEEGYRVTTRTSSPSDQDTIVRLQPSLIVLDHVAPGEASWSLIQRLKRHRETCGIPVVLCTGAHRQIKAHASLLAALDVAVVPKPFDIEQFTTVVRGALGSPVGD